jgi:hypothetical protein
VTFEKVTVHRMAKTGKIRTPARRAGSGTNRAVPTSAAKATADRSSDGAGETIRPIDLEPWVALADASELAGWGESDEIRYNQRNRQAEKYLFFRRTFDFLKENAVRGDYHEYGCHRARTFRMALTEARRQNLSNMKFWAFDSFAGLPSPVEKTSVAKWTAGALATSEEAFLALIHTHGLYTTAVNTVKGFFAESLHADRQRAFLERENRIALATIDCDLYESAVPVFGFIEPLLRPGSIIYLDDLFVGNRGDPRGGVARAFAEFRKRTRWGFVRHLDVGWWGRSYITIEGEASARV